MTENKKEYIEPKVEKKTVKSVVDTKDLFSKIQGIEDLKKAPRSVKRKLLKEAKKARKKALR